MWAICHVYDNVSVEAKNWRRLQEHWTENVVILTKFHHWLHRKLSKWQLSVQPEMRISSKWRHFRFSENQRRQHVDLGTRHYYHVLVLNVVNVTVTFNHEKAIYFWICNYVLPVVLLSLDLLLEKWIDFVTILCIKLFSARIFYKGVLCFVTDCPWRLVVFSALD